MKAKKIIKWVCGIAAVLLAAVLLLIGSFIYVTKYKKTDIDFSISDDGQYEVIYQAVGEPDWPFGYSHARIVLKHDGKTIIKRKFDVANDGGVLHSDSWSVSWEENCVKVIISGEEQPDVLYSFHFDGTVRVASPVDLCKDPVINFSDIVEENANGESVFAVSAEAFIDCYNKAYQQNYRETYLTAITSDEWYCSTELSPCFGYESVRYEFSEDKTVWSMPTISVYAPDNDEIYEIRMTFDDHGYQEQFYLKYQGLCCCLLKMACPNLSDKEIQEVFLTLYSLSDENFFGEHNAYGDPMRPTLSKVLQSGNIGFYCFYGAGYIEICMIPLTSTAIELLQADGVDIQSL